MKRKEKAKKERMEMKMKIERELRVKKSKGEGWKEAIICSDMGTRQTNREKEKQGFFLHSRLLRNGRPLSLSFSLSQSPHTGSHCHVTTHPHRSFPQKKN